MPETARERAPQRLSLLDPRVMDPDSEILDHAHLEPAEIDQVVAVLDAMRDWREVERAMSESARRYMQLGDTDMRALRYLIAAQCGGIVATPGSISAHLGISPAATTKLIDRLEAAHHLRRLPHPDDRRRTAIEVTEATRVSARESVGRSHGRRFDAVAGLSADDREAVLRFFAALSDSAEWSEPGFDGAAPGRERADRAR